MIFGFPYHRFLRPARGEQFVHMMSPLGVNSYILGICSEPGPLSSKGSLSCHTCFNTGIWFLCFLPKDPPIQLALPTSKMYRWPQDCSNPDPHGPLLQNLGLNRTIHGDLTVLLRVHLCELFFSIRLTIHVHVIFFLNLKRFLNNENSDLKLNTN